MTTIWFSRWRERRRAFARIESSLLALHGKVDDLMATETQLKSDLDAIKDGVTALAAKLVAQTATITDLKNQVAAGTPVTQEQLDALESEAAEIASTISGLTTPTT